MTEAKVRLGKMLFFDKRLSINQLVSCESCHSRDRGRGSLITLDRIAQTIATYGRTLMIPHSPFDRYQASDFSVLKPQAQRGWKKFQDIACIACLGAPTFVNQDYFVPFPLRSSKESNLH